MKPPPHPSTPMAVDKVDQDRSAPRINPEQDGDAELEIGHVLFMDIVGFSKLMVDEQRDASHRLNQVVRSTEQFHAAEAADRLIRLPTGDGMVLVFYTSPEAPARCAMEIAEALKHDTFGLRMGIHSGPVNHVSDVNDRSNLAGTGINLAQRVMDCGDTGHILLSKRVAEDLDQHSKWRPRLHHLGEFEVKHGIKIDITNLYTDKVGNPALPAKLKDKKVAPASPVARFGKPLATAFLLAIALVGFALYRYQHKPGDLALAMVFPGKSIAVLPFKPLVASNRDEVLEAGMADTLIAKLSSAREMIVPSLMAVRKYDDQTRDSVATGRALRVNSVLEGSLQKAGDRIRVTARLIKTIDGSSMWSGTFDEKFTDVFSVQDSIAQKVAAALAVPLNAEEQNRLTKRYTENTEAYQTYLKGRFYWNKYTEDGFHKSIEYFKQAVEKDPNYALAYSGLADSYSIMGDLSYGMPAENFGQARSYAEKALALDDSLASAHLSYGIVKLFYDWDLQGGAEKELRRAKELEPNNAQVYHFYGHYLELSGRLDDAITETKHGVDLDPTNLILANELAWAYYCSHRFDEAIALYRKNLEADQNFIYSAYQLAQCYEQKGMFREALAELTRIQKIDNWSFVPAEIACVKAFTGKRAEAEAIMVELKTRSAREYIDESVIAYIPVALGDKDQAFAWLEKAYQSRAGNLPWMKVEPKFDPLRSDPRFDDLLRRMRLK